MTLLMTLPPTIMGLIRQLELRKKLICITLHLVGLSLILWAMAKLWMSEATTLSKLGEFLGIISRALVYRGLYSYRELVHVIPLFPIFKYCCCMLSEFAKVFERKTWRVQVAHWHNEARARLSAGRCFQLSTNLGKDFFRYLWYCGKKTNGLWFNVALLVKFHWFEIN